MTKIIRVYSKNSEDIERWEDFELTPNRENVIKAEIYDVIPEHKILKKTLEFRA